MSEADTKTLPKTSNTSGTKEPRHIVENRDFGGEPKAAFNPEDKTLCGKLWDRLNVQHNGEICQACVDEMRKRGGSV